MIITHTKSMYHAYNVMKIALIICGLLPKTHNPSLIIRKTSYKHFEGHWYSSKLSRSFKTYLHKVLQARA